MDEFEAIENECNTQAQQITKQKSQSTHDNYRKVFQPDAARANARKKKLFDDSDSDDSAHRDQDPTVPTGTGNTAVPESNGRSTLVNKLFYKDVP